MSLKGSWIGTFQFIQHLENFFFKILFSLKIFLKILESFLETFFFILFKNHHILGFPRFENAVDNSLHLLCGQFHTLLTIRARASIVKTV